MLARSSTSGVVLASAVLLRLTAPVNALEPEDVLFYKKGPFSVRPQLAISEQYNDNIFYQPTDPVEDFLTIVNPGLKLQLGRPEHNYVSLGYTYGHLFYMENSELDSGQHTIELGNQFRGQRWTLNGTDRIQLLSSPLGGLVERVVGANGISTIIGGNVDRLAIDDSYTLSYDLGEKTGVYVRAAHTSSDYQEGVALYDIRTVTGTGGFAYKAFPKTIFFGEVYYGQTRTEPNHPQLVNNPRLDFVGGYAGARGNFTEKLFGMAKVGYESREFADGAEAPSVPVVDVSLTQRFSEKQALSLTYSRANNVSIQYSRQTYTADTVGLQFSQILGPRRKWQATLGGSYALYSYEATGAGFLATEYNYLRGTFNLGYQIQRWLTANASYEHERVSGESRAVIDYSVNRVTLRLTIGY